jgi:hypothetical protein
MVTFNFRRPNRRASERSAIYTSNLRPLIAPPRSRQTRSPTPSIWTRVPNGSSGGQAAVTPSRTRAPDAVIPYAGWPGALPVDSGPDVYAVTSYVSASGTDVATENAVSNAWISVMVAMVACPFRYLSLNRVEVRGRPRVDARYLFAQALGQFRDLPLGTATLPALAVEIEERPEVRRHRQVGRGGIR